jgi:hypothetical protein
MRQKNLEQVLRVRALMEDRARAELETRANVVRQMEDAAAGQRGGALAIRREGLAELAKGEARRGEAGPGESGRGEFRQAGVWLLDVADAEILEWKSEQLRLRAEAEKPVVAEAREAMLERRRERQQMETLVGAARRAEEQERVRREQQQVDDWFQGRVGGRGALRKD